MPNALTDAAMPMAGPPGLQEAPTPPEQAPAPPEAPTPPEGPAGSAPDAPQGPKNIHDAGIDPEKLQDTIHKATIIDAKLEGLLAKIKITRGDVIHMVSQLVAEKIMEPADGARYLSDVPEEPDDIKEWVQRHADEGKMLHVQMVYAQHGSALEGPTEQAGAAPEAPAEAPAGAMPEMPQGMPGQERLQ